MPGDVTGPERFSNSSCDKNLSAGTPSGHRRNFGGCRFRTRPDRPILLRIRRRRPPVAQWQQLPHLRRAPRTS
ncbi:MAG: hypothetical protein BJ554DRAFT_5485 [Olpidium bornovanus]|uniref:Uncharacterized protein n=1 Tax=Olpidium bornovanus TaxID=278681 RepID=A0A8H8DKZ6_9FUNG|nr:MAG: hypothetical protein BJ554DRAFT_5485 [Olpidium bornovanus]